MQTVVILICTCNRPRYLDELLAALVTEVPSAQCSILSVVVVDNGTHTVERMVEGYRRALPVEYVRLPQQGLVGARNCSLRYGLRHAPDYLVFIDDDEVPATGWLDGLLSAMNTSGAGFAVGPVQPKFAEAPPEWAPQFFTKSGETFCTSNLMLRASIIPSDEGEWFQSRFNSTGGEDGDFLRRLAASGAGHAVAPSALVLENIPPDRVTATYLWRRGYRDGVVMAMACSSRASGMLFNLLRGGSKIVFGINHLVWSITDPARFYRAIDDISVGCGLFMGSAGGTIKFYGD